MGASDPAYKAAAGVTARPAPHLGVPAAGLPCRADPELWFREDPHSVQAAKHGCRSCPALDECQAWALGHDEVWGTWGGLTARERHRAYRARWARRAAEAVAS
jgi:hypothetical protein